MFLEARSKNVLIKAEIEKTEIKLIFFGGILSFRFVVEKNMIKNKIRNKAKMEFLWD